MPPENNETELETLLAHQEAVERLIQLEGELSTKQEQRVMKARAAFASAEQAKSKANELEEQHQALIDKHREDGTTYNRYDHEAMEQRIASQKKLAAAYAQQEVAIKKLQEATEKYQKESEKRVADAGAEGIKRLEETSAKMTSQADLNAQGMLNTIEQSVENIGGAFQDLKANPAMALGAIFTGALPSIGALKTAILSMPAEMDKSFSSVVKNTNMGADAAKKSMTAMMDPLHAAIEDESFRNLAADSKLLSNIGLTADDVGKSMSGLMNNVAMFRPEFIENNKAQAAFIGNLTAGLTKVGVPIETSAKNLNRFTKAMGKSPKEAATGLKQLTGIADSLGLSFGKVSSNFATVGGDMVQFGDKAIGVFANLQAQATATGMSINELTDFAKGLDTFEGAAQKAQGLNAVLGGTFVSVTDLVNADFDEKIELMQNAMGDAGIEFDQADRRMKQVIASAAGLSVEQASKMFGNVDASEEMKGAVDDQATSQEELSGKIFNAMSISEKATKTLSSLAGGVSMFNKRLSKGAEGIAGTVADSFGKLQEATGNSEASLVGIVGQLEGMEVVGKTVTSVINNLGKAIGANPAGMAALAAVTATAGAAAAVQASEGSAKQKAKNEAEAPASTTPPDRADTEALAPPGLAEFQAASAPRGDQAAASTPGDPVQINLLLDGEVLVSVMEDKNVFMKKPVQLLA